VATGEHELGRVGVIGGTGFYEFLDDPRTQTVDTPYGPPSDVITIGIVADREVVFLPRHGRDHQWPPHRIPYRANIWAMRSLGVTAILAPCAVGSLQAHLPPGTIVVPDQLVDRTTSRSQTFVESGVAHVSFADPYCPVMRAAVATAARSDPAAGPVRDGGTMVVIEGPRFSTRAESRWYSDQGWDLVNMTGHPEAVLAREQEICYAAVALVTDMDAGVERADTIGPAVTQAEAIAVFRANTERMRRLIGDAIGAIPAQHACECRSALQGMDVTHTP